MEDQTKLELDAPSVLERGTPAQIRAHGSTTTTSLKNIVVIGAGYGGITAALRLAKYFGDSREYEIHLVDKNPFHTLKTQLHEAAARKEEVTIDIGSIIRRRAVIFHLGIVTSIDLAEQGVQIGRERLGYEYLVLALGSQTNYYGIPGLRENAFSLDTAEDALRIFAHISKLFARASSMSESALRMDMLRFVIGGGGLTGVEFASELFDRVMRYAGNYHIPSGEVEIVLLEAGRTILPTLDGSLRGKTEEKLRKKGVKILTGERIVSCSEGVVTTSSGNSIRTGTIVWTGGIRITDLAGQMGISTGQLGRIVVDPFLRSINRPHVFAIGDNALAMNPATGTPVPAAAQFALQQGRIVADNIRADVKGEALKQYRPRVWGEVISLGKHLAVGWLALPVSRKLRFLGFLASLVKTAIKEKHIFLLRTASRTWISY